MLTAVTPGHLTIIPTFDSSITKDPKAAQIEAAINAAINVYETTFTNPVTVKFEFKEGQGLGSGSFTGVDETYTAWRTALIAHATNASQQSAIAASVPAGSVDPVVGNSLISLTPANAVMLGFNVPAKDLNAGGFDDTISLQTSICNLTRTSIDPAKYDLQSVTEHEIDEALGISSNMDGIGLKNGDPAPTEISPVDLFRYAKAGQRSFNTDSATKAFFSIDAGKTDLAQFNQDAGGDFGDWLSADGTQVPQVQDAFGTAGVITAMNVEFTRLEILGYDPNFTVGTGIVGGTVFNDVNGNGVQNSGDANLSGWTVEATQNGKVVTSTTSDALGYQIGGLADGTYTIEVLPKAGFTQTLPIASYSVTITGHNETLTGKNFGETAGTTGNGLFTSAASIGSPKLAGSASFANGVYTVKGAGRDIYGQTDQFEFDSTNVTGNTTIIANVASIVRTEVWAKGGVMIRASAAPNSAFADVVVTADNGVAFQWRSKTGASAQSVDLLGYHAAQFIKLVRSGNAFSAYTLAKTGKWLQIGTSQTIVMASNALAGLVVTSVAPDHLCTATFTDVSLNGKTTVADQILK